MINALLNNLIKQCRYYNGEKECPQIIQEKEMSTIWYYEQIWVEREDLRDEKGFNTEEYIHYGLTDFSPNDGTPISLKALLFNRHTHWCGGYGAESDIKNFKEWYNNSYIALSK